MKYKIGDTVYFYEYDLCDCEDFIFVKRNLAAPKRGTIVEGLMNEDGYFYRVSSEELDKVINQMPESRLFKTAGELKDNTIDACKSSIAEKIADLKQVAYEFDHLQ